MKRILILIIFGGLLSWAAWARAADWSLDIQVLTPDPAANGGFAKADLSAGTDQTATDGFDLRWDAEPFTLQAAGSALPIAAYFDHLEDPPNPALWRDFRAPIGQAASKDWEIRVSATTNQEVTLRWRLLSSGCEARRFLLIDRQAGLEMEIADGGSYTFFNDSGARAFTLRVLVFGASTVPDSPISFWSPRSTGGSVLLSWSGSGPFIVYRSATAKSGYQKIASVDDSFYLDQVLSGTYHYAVTAVGPGGCESAFSEELTVQVE